MIVNRLSQLLGERQESVRDLARATGMAYTTAYRLGSGRATRLDLDTLDLVCAHLGVEVGDILEYVPTHPRLREVASE